MGIRPPVRDIPFRHSHPLVLNEEGRQSKEVCCSGCLESLYGPSFSCEECNFHIHKRCAEAPLHITSSPFHRKCPSNLSLFATNSRTYTCDICNGESNMFSYLFGYYSPLFGYDSNLSIDIKCALLLHNIDDNFLQLKYFAHHHPLTFIQNPTDELQSCDCYWCHKPVGVHSLYACLDCGFYLHKRCAQFPSQLNHPSHRKHLLYSVTDELLCGVCQKSHAGLFYCCFPCKFNIHIECFRTKSNIIEDKSCHEHPLTLLLRHNPFFCDACGTEGNCVSYVCSVCHILIHGKCISLPRIIRSTRHHHHLVHNYAFKKKDPFLKEYDECGICLREVKASYGSYECVKKICDFVVHVDCALERGRYEVVDEVNDEEEQSSGDFALGSCITCAEKNENGEALKIKYFSHDHELTLGHKVDEENDHNRCEGCMLYISPNSSFYYCSQCHFFLHKTCVELPKKKYHWFYKGLTTLTSVKIFYCNQCHLWCNGYAYQAADGGDRGFCLRCASVSHTPICEGHEHKLFFDYNFRGQCNACGKYGDAAFQCRYCANFASHKGCITLPRTTRHKCDIHFLKLTFVEKNDNPEQHYCDICEEKRDPNHWFYHCEICDNSVHPRCALGRYPFIKISIGSIFPTHRHTHDLIFVENTYEKCSECGNPCTDVAIWCSISTCDYIIHLDCW